MGIGGIGQQEDRTVGSAPSQEGQGMSTTPTRTSASSTSSVPKTGYAAQQQALSPVPSRPVASGVFQKPDGYASQQTALRPEPTAPAPAPQGLGPQPGSSAVPNPNARPLSNTGSATIALDTGILLAQAGTLSESLRTGVDLAKDALTSQSDDKTVPLMIAETLLGAALEKVLGLAVNWATQKFGQLIRAQAFKTGWKNSIEQNAYDPGSMIDRALAHGDATDTATRAFDRYNNFVIQAGGVFHLAAGDVKKSVMADMQTSLQGSIGLTDGGISSAGLDGFLLAHAKGVSWPWTWVEKSLTQLKGSLQGANQAQANLVLEKAQETLTGLRAVITPEAHAARIIGGWMNAAFQSEMTQKQSVGQRPDVVGSALIPDTPGVLTIRYEGDPASMRVISANMVGLPNKAKEFMGSGGLLSQVPLSDLGVTTVFQGGTGAPTVVIPHNEKAPSETWTRNRGAPGKYDNRLTPAIEVWASMKNLTLGDLSIDNDAPGIFGKSNPGLDRSLHSTQKMVRGSPRTSALTKLTRTV